MLKRNQALALYIVFYILGSPIDWGLKYQ